MCVSQLCHISVLAPDFYKKEREDIAYYLQGFPLDFDNIVLFAELIELGIFKTAAISVKMYYHQLKHKSPRSAGRRWLQNSLLSSR